MAATSFSADIPRRLVLDVPVLQRITDNNIDQLCDIVSARLRWLVSREYQRRNAARLKQRLDARAALKVERLEAAARRAVAAESANAFAPRPEGAGRARD